MAGRGPETFKKKQKEQKRREKRQEKLAKKLERRRQAQTGSEDSQSVAVENSEEELRPGAAGVYE